MRYLTPLCEVSRVVKSRETESRKVTARSWGEGAGGLLFHKCGVSVLQDRKSSGDRRTTQKCLKYRSTYLKVIKMTNFIL